MKTYKFKLYQHKRNRYLHYIINTSARIYNHCIALHKRYYKMFGKHLNQYRLMKHIAKLRKRIKYWQQVGSQSVQDICQRIEKAYQLFFKNYTQGTKPPNFKKTRKYKSFTLKQAGYKFLGGNQIKIGKRTYKFALSRELLGNIKTITVKRNYLSELFIFVVTDSCDESKSVMTGNIAGFDFGLKTFLSVSDGTTIESPLFFQKFRSLLKKASKNLSQKRKGSNNWRKAKANLARVHELIANKRQDWFWKLAHQLANKYDVLIFEDLNLKGMQRLWGRKVSDLSFSSFLEILICVAKKKGKIIHFVDRFFPSSKTCSDCGYINQELSLKQRQWDCPNCKKEGIKRDLNAAINICREGASSLRLDTVRLPLLASVA